MSLNDFTLNQPTLSGSTLYFVADAAAGRWNGSALEAVNLAHWSTYAVAMTEAAGTGAFKGTVPAALSASAVALTAFVKAGGSPAATDNPAGTGAYSPGPQAAVNADDLAFTVQRGDLGGSFVYGVFDSPGGLRWNGTAFETIVAANQPTYAVAGSEAGGSGSTGLFRVVPPAGIAANYTNASFYRKAGSTPAATDEFLGNGSITLAAGETAFNVAIASAVATQGVTLTSAGLDAVMIESSPPLNARQTLSLMAAESVGVLAQSGNVYTFKSAGGVVPRVSATTDDNGNRTAVVVSPPT